MPETKIEWTDRSWNPVRGCTRVSPGCVNCYAERLSARELPGHASPTTGEPFARMTKGGPRWTGAVEFLPHKLAEPLSWRRPARVFVNSMSDLFHEALSFPQIAAVLGVVAACPHLTFQVLTKRPEVAAEWYAWIASVRETEGSVGHFAERALGLVGQESARHFAAVNAAILRDEWPLPNLELGTSVEDQPTADLRIPEILRCPAAVHFVSYEPALAAVDFKRSLARYRSLVSGMRYTKPGAAGDHEVLPGIDWIIVGGESGPGARPFDVAWARETVRQCREAGVPVFVKQLGSSPIDNELAFARCCSCGWYGANAELPRDSDHACGADRCPECGEEGGITCCYPSEEDARLGANPGEGSADLTLRDRKGGDPSEWPEDLRVREFPRERRLVA